MTIKENTPCRVIFGVTCFADANPAINIAVDLAKIMDAQINALLIEDDAISGFATLPFARTISVTGERTDKITPAIMRQAFKRDAEIFKRELSHAAEKAMLQWSFEKRSGLISSLLEQNVSSGDFVLFGYQKFTQKSSQEILVLENLTQQNKQLLKLANSIADKMGFNVSKLVLSDGKDADILKYIQGKNLVTVVTSQTVVKQLGLNNLINASRCPVIAAI